jgi:SAM-dependent methyltransferase
VAKPLQKVEFRQASAEDSGLAAESVDLITVAQALHWFDIPVFFEESRRVLKTAGLLAFWCYAGNQVDPDCDSVIGRLFAEVEDFWLPERALVESHYRDIESPFPELPAPAFEMSVNWSADDMLGYFHTWSATRRYMRERKTDPAAGIEADLRQAWGQGRRRVRWPLVLRLSRK